MDVGTNKTRKDTRAVVSLVARYRSPSTFEYVEEACCDVSLGGMFIRSKDPAAAGTLLKLECESGSVGAQIRGVARVVWLRAQPNEYGPSGMGVKFVKLDPESKDVITRIVQELAAEGIESPSMSSAPEQRGKPPVKRGASSTPAAAEPQLPAAEPAAALPMAASQTAPKEVALVQQRGSDRPGDLAQARVSSKPPALPRVSSRPAPNDALLAHTSVDALDIEPGPSMRDIGRELSPLAPVLRTGRTSSAPPPADNDRGRAFWLVAGAVVALGVIVAIFSTRGAQDSESGQQEAKGASPAVQAPPPPVDTTAEAAEQAQPSAAELANAQPGSGTEPAAAADPAAAPADSTNAAANTAEGAPAAPGEVAEPAVPSTPEVAQVAIAAPGTTEPPKPSTGEPAAASPQARPATPAQPTSPPTAATTAPEVPVLRIVPAEPTAAADQSDKAAQPGATQPQAAAQPSAEVAQPSAAKSADANKPSATQPLAANIAASSSTPASTTQPPSPSANVAPPPLAPGEVAHVIMFTSRPTGASIFVGNQTVVTPGELNLGAMPGRVRVTAQKPGFESSTVWINNVAEFQKVGGVLRREVHFVLPALPAGAATQPAAPAQPAPSQPSTPTQAPSQPPAAAIPAQP